LTSSSAPVLITLETGGWESDIKKRKFGGKIREYGGIAMHDPIAHMLGETCVRIYKVPSGYHPLVNGHNIFKVLEHESLHHVMQNFYDSNDDTLDQLLDSLPNYNPLRVRLLPCP
jgi:hypothetical protein